MSAAFRRELDEQNRRRLLVMLPMMTVLHLVHVAAFRTPEAGRAALDPTFLAWRDAVALVHAASAGVAVFLGLVVLALGRTRAAPALAPLVGVAYMAHAAAISGVDQLNTTTVTPFIGYTLGIAVTLCLTPAATVVIYTTGLLLFVVAIWTFQPSPELRAAILPNGPSITVVSAVLATFLHVGRRRDFLQRTTIEQQRAALEQLNADLAQRVRDQVSEIVARARDVERLNERLQAQVRARSNELSAALGEVADRRVGELSEGMVLAGRFEVGRRLGAGAMGAVHAGVDRTTGERVAIKVIQASTAAELDALHRFLREARAASAVTHPAVVRMLHVDVSEGGLFFQVQELVEGQTLHAILDRTGALEAGVAARIGAVLCEALAAAHAKGVVHRDVKPGNVMLTPVHPGLKLLDFGISKVAGEAAAGATQTGMVLGTPAFMSPEHMDGSGALTDRSDVYAAGITLFLMVAGRHPFDDTSFFGVVGSHLEGGPPDVRRFRPDAPEPLARLVAASVAGRAAHRPSAADLARDLHHLADALRAPPLDRILRERRLGEASDAFPTLAGTP